ncbi:MAG TPA: class I SAM-dependent methyltransferase [Gammaproteobacteria bacterium]|nr:class I SAM-dependent methyltransferase [Gammaproteobacteria bacterium]
MNAGKRAAQAWRVLGATDPYFAVLTERRFEHAARPGESREAFFRSGEDDVAQLFARIAADHPSFAPRRALDFGCGVGRLVLPLARRVAEVVGVDVSPAMLEEARKNCAEAGARNTAFVETDSAEYRAAGNFDLVHSVIVFQHIPRRVGLRLARELIGRLSPGGVGALHFVYSVRRPLWWRWAYFARKTVPGLHRAANLARGHRAARPLMEMNAYPLAALYELVHDCGAARVTSFLTDHDGFLGAMLIFRKPG